MGWPSRSRITGMETSLWIVTIAIVSLVVVIMYRGLQNRGTRRRFGSALVVTIGFILGFLLAAGLVWPPYAYPSLPYADMRLAMRTLGESITQTIVVGILGGLAGVLLG